MLFSEIDDEQLDDVQLSLDQVEVVRQTLSTGLRHPSSNI